MKRTPKQVLSIFDSSKSLSEDVQTLSMHNLQFDKLPGKLSANYIKIRTKLDDAAKKAYQDYEDEDKDVIKFIKSVININF